MRFMLAGLGLLLITYRFQTASAADAPCPMAGQHHMAIVQMFFGQSSGNRTVSADEWSAFVKETITPRFPEGFTVLAGNGQWMDHGTQTVQREDSKVVEIAAESSPATYKRLEEVADVYKRLFNQRSVGIIVSRGCAAF